LQDRSVALGAKRVRADGVADEEPEHGAAESLAQATVSPVTPMQVS
jgi:hypothetical protein